MSDWVDRTDSFSELLAVSDKNIADILPKRISPATLSLLYDNHWLVAKICDLPVDLGLKDGFYTEPKADDVLPGEEDVLGDPTADPNAPPADPKDPKAAVKDPKAKPVALKKDALPGAPVAVAVKVPMTEKPVPGKAGIQGQGQVDPLAPPGAPPPPDNGKGDLESDEGYQAFLKWNRTEYAPDGIVHKAAKLGRLQGGHAVIVGTTADPAVAYADEEVMWIDEVARTELSVKVWDEDANSPRYRQPEIFEVAAGHARGPLEIHFSKVIIFPGLTIAGRVPWQERHWTKSVLQPMLNALAGYDNAIEGLAKGLARFDVGILESAGLFDALDQLNKAEIDARKQVFNDGIKNSRTVFLDPSKQEKYSRIPLNFAGVPEAIQIMKDDVAGASGLPQTHVFGIQQEGLGKGGTQEKIVSDYVDSYKENVLRPALEKLMSLILQTPMKVTFEKPKAAPKPNDGDPSGENPEDGGPLGGGPMLEHRDPKPDLQPKDPAVG